MTLPPSFIFGVAYFARQQRASDVDGVDGVEHILGVIGDRRDDAEVAGVAEQHVDFAPARHGRSDAAFDVGSARYVGGDVVDRQSGEIRERLLRRRFAEVDQGDARAFGDELPRRSEANAAGAAGDQAGFAAEQSHLAVLPSRALIDALNSFAIKLSPSYGGVKEKEQRRRRARRRREDGMGGKAGSGSAIGDSAPQ